MQQLEARVAVDVARNVFEQQRTTGAESQFEVVDRFEPVAADRIVWVSQPFALGDTLAATIAEQNAISKRDELRARRVADMISRRVYH